MVPSPASPQVSSPAPTPELGMFRSIWPDRGALSCVERDRKEARFEIREGQGA